MSKDFLLTTGLLAGTIIGAGIFSLPYVVSRVGVFAGFFYLAAFTLVYFVIHIMYAKLVEKEGGRHQFFYLANLYLPQKISRVVSFLILAGLFFILTVYLILAPTFAGLIFGPLASSGLIALFIFWFLSSVFIFAKLSFLDWAELAGTLSILAIVLIIFFMGLKEPFHAPLLKSVGWPLVFLPFGPLLFSLAGRPAISKMVEGHRQAKAEGRNFSLRKTIFWGTVIPALVYVLFVIGILRLNPNVSPEALNSLSFLSPFFLALLGILGLLTLWTSYFVIGANIKDVLRLDLKKPAWFSSLAVLTFPLILYFSGFKNFLTVISFTGGVFLGLEGIFVIAMWRKAFPKNKWRGIALPLYLIFLAALIYEIVVFVL